VIKIFKDTPGAQSNDGLTTKLVQNGVIVAETGHLGTARGAAYGIGKSIRFEAGW